MDGAYGGSAGAGGSASAGGGVDGGASAGVAAQARGWRRKRGRVWLRCRASFAPVRKKVKKLLEGAKVTQSQHRVYDLRQFRAGAKVTQNRRVVCDWDLFSIKVR